MHKVSEQGRNEDVYDYSLSSEANYIRGDDRLQPFSPLVIRQNDAGRWSTHAFVTSPAVYMRLVAPRLPSSSLSVATTIAEKKFFF